MRPEDFKPNSHKKVWWKCKEEHEWQTRIVYRTRQKSGCPYCLGRVAGADNSLEVLYPNLAKEWHPEKNGELTPGAVRPGTDRKVWWICDKGHSWQASIYNRTHETKATGCPYCSGRYATKENNLASLFPDLLDEWNFDKNAPLKPDKLKPGSNRKVWWKCKKGHEWKISPNKRTGGDKTGCPHCKPQTSRLEIRILCELMYFFDEVKWREKIDGIEADIYVPEYSFAIEVDGYHWHLNREEKDRIKRKELNKHGIELLRLRDKRLERIDDSDTFFNENEDDIVIIHRLLRSMLKYLPLNDEDRTTILSYFKFASPQNKKEYKRFLSYLPSPPPEYSIAHLHENLLPEWHYKKNPPLTPENFTPGAGAKVWWKCTEGHEYKSSINNRVKGVGCPYCAGKKVSPDNNFAFKAPHLINEWHHDKNKTIMPDKIYYRSSKKVWWQCAKGHEWRATLNNRVRGTGCPYCTGRKVSSDNNLSALFPEIAKEWNFGKNVPLKPDDVTSQSHKIVWWKCKKGHEWKTSIGNRTGIQKSGCPYCRGQKVSPDNNLRVVYPEIAREWHYSKNAPQIPNQFRPSSNKKVWWQCSQNHEWQAVIANRTVSNNNCPYCSGKKKK